ncbi:MAG: hypothetical protein GF400_00570 [Candidatus Eisenbacteria bacterium]|nr:hypothetical protein [Candidatus Eisenbacteria bacterium]
MAERETSLLEALEVSESLSDADLYRAVVQCLGESGLIGFLSSHNMAEPLPQDRLEELRVFVGSQSRRGMAFGDAGLERSRRALARSCRDLLAAIEKYTTLDVFGRPAVPRVLTHEDPGKFDVTVYRLNRLASRCVGAYQQFRRRGEARLARR